MNLKMENFGESGKPECMYQFLFFVSGEKCESVLRFIALSPSPYLRVE